MKRLSLQGLITCLLFTVANTVSASAVYQYTSNTYESTSSPYTTSMNILATIELASLLSPNLTDERVTPTSYSIFDGIKTIDQSNADLTKFSFSTDSNGDIIDWAVTVQDTQVIGDPGGNIFTSLLAPGASIDGANIYECFDESCSSFTGAGSAVSHVPGTWTVTAVPIPAAVWLFGSGLLGLVGISRRRKAD